MMTPKPPRAAEDDVDYLNGFGGTHQSEALPGAVPEGQNSPRHAPYGLYAEQLNGVPFTVPRASNVRSWLYRIRPSVEQGELEPIEGGRFGLDYLTVPPTPDLMGWAPRALAGAGGPDFLASLETTMGAGDPAEGPGLALHTYSASADMVDVALCSADGDVMLLPDTGRLRIQTELGFLQIAPGELAVIPRGMPFSVALPSGPSRGIVLESYGRHFALPERGPIGANGMADPRHFQIPTAAYEDRAVDGGFRMVVKLGGHLSEARREHSPFDVVGWHGNYVPFKYDLRMYNAMGTVTFDHPDPSIWTVLSAPLYAPGENLADLVVFPNPRWDVSQHTLRPPFYHRNAATELNAILDGPSKDGEVFTNGGVFLTPPFAGHGVATATIERHLRMSDEEANRPAKLAGDSLWIQFESTLALRVAPWATRACVEGFRDFARGVRVRFDPRRPQGDVE